MDEQLPQARPASGGTRKHMGVATSDPEYLPPVGTNRTPGHVPPTSSTLRVRGVDTRRDPNSPSAQPNYSRYISTPKKGRAIFTSRQDRKRRRIKLALGVMIVAAVALALVWFFVLR